MNDIIFKTLLLKGEAGNNIASIEKTATSGLVDTYTITLTDGSTTTFEVTNGKSIVSMEKTNTIGFTDYYTITFNDNTTIELQFEKQVTYRKNVAQMGVDNTGATDASATLNALLQEGGAFYLPAGTYLLESQLLIPSNVDIKGDGTNTVLLASPNLDAVYHTVCSENAQNINARLCRNEEANGYPDTSLCDHYVENVKISDLLINGNWQNRDLENWEHYYINGDYTISREYGTNLELQRVRNVVVDNVTFINGIQHNFNVRAGAYSYNMGLDYVADYPSYHVYVTNCYSNNHRFDDSFTTHDSEYITFENCMCEELANVDGSIDTTISNGFEIDDGSRYVTVNNCISKYSLCGFQAKGHTNTPSAHDVTFNNCVAMYTRDGFSLACGKANGNFNTDVLETGRCYNITLNNCKALHLYPVNNVEAWAKTVRPIEFKDCLNCDVNNFVFDPTRPTDVSNIYEGDDVRTVFNFRGVNYNINLNNIIVTDDIVANYNDTALFVISGTSGHISIDGVKMKGYTGNYQDTFHPPIIKYTNNNIYNYLAIRNVYAKKLNSYDKILQISDLQNWHECLLQGSRENLVFYNIFQGDEWTDKYGFENEVHTGESQLSITPIGNTCYILSKDCTVTLGDTTYMRLSPIAFVMSGGATTDTITVNVISTDQPDFNITKTLHKRECLVVQTTKQNGLIYQ
jgi:hypothetical protein